LEDYALARELLEPMAEIAQRRGGWAAGVYHFHAGWDALARGDAIAALHHVEMASATAEAQGPPFGRNVTPLLLAQVFWQAGRAREANEALATAKRRADEAGCAVFRYGCFLVESDLAWDDDRDRALCCLRDGLGFARERGYHNVFGLARGTLERVAVRALAHGIEPDHLSVTIRKHRLKPDRLSPRLENWPWRYRIRALGSFSLSQDHAYPSRAPTERDDGGGPRGMPLRLLQAVIAFGGRGVRDVKIIDALWPEAEGDAGRRVLDTTLHRLRRQLGDYDFVRLNDGRFSLDERICWLDLWAFDDFALQMEREVARGAPAAVLVDLARQLLGLYRAPLLAEDGGASLWANGPRERLHAKFCRLARPLADALERSGHHDEAASLHVRYDELYRPAHRHAPIVATPLLRSTAPQRAPSIRRSSPSK
jgi:DNA-binding SARP family transcriptional activator